MSDLSEEITPQERLQDKRSKQVNVTGVLPCLAKTGFELSAMPPIAWNCNRGSTVGIALIMAPAMTAIFPAHIYFIGCVARGVVWNQYL